MDVTTRECRSNDQISAVRFHVQNHALVQRLCLMLHTVSYPIGATQVREAVSHTISHVLHKLTVTRLPFISTHSPH